MNREFEGWLDLLRALESSGTKGGAEVVRG